jgi:hypothetical protein
MELLATIETMPPLLSLLIIIAGVWFLLFILTIRVWMAILIGGLIWYYTLL